MIMLKLAPNAARKSSFSNTIAKLSIFAALALGAKLLIIPLILTIVQRVANTHTNFCHVNRRDSFSGWCLFHLFLKSKPHGIGVNFMTLVELTTYEAQGITTSAGASHIRRSRVR